MTSHVVQARTLIDSRAPDADPMGMDRPETSPDQHTPECIVCGRAAVTIDRDDTPMCAKHAAIFVTRDHRSSVAERGRVVR